MKEGAQMTDTNHIKPDSFGNENSREAQALAQMGEGHVVYVKPMLSDQISALYPGAPEMQPGLELFAVLSASGAPIILTDSRDTAIAEARKADLEPVSVH